MGEAHGEGRVRDYWQYLGGKLGQFEGGGKLSSLGGGAVELFGGGGGGRGELPLHPLPLDETMQGPK